MKKVSLMLGALGGAVAGYLFTNSKLREELAKAKNAEEAGKIFAKHLGTDGKKLGEHVKDFVESDAVKENLGKAKSYAQKQFTKAKFELQALIKKNKKAAPVAAKKMVAGAKKAAKGKKA